MNGPQDIPQRRPLFSKKRNRRSKTRNETQNGTGREQTHKSRPVGKQKQDRRGETLVKESELKDLPVPAPLQLKALSNLLNSILIKHGMSIQDIVKRRTIFEDVKQLLQKEIPDCIVRSYGSSYSCLGLKTSDVNIDVHDDNEEKIPGIFMILLNLLNNDKRYSDVKEEFDTKWPTIYFTEIKSGLICKVNTGNNTACFTSCLLKIYDELDSRVKPLCVSLKLWAKICKVDCQATGTLPSYSFLLMVVHFLQQTKPPVLPVIHEKLGDEDITKYFENPNFSEEILAKIRSNRTTTNTDCLGALWLGLLRYYSDETKIETIIINVRQEKSILRSSRDGWGKRKYAIEDPFSNKRNVARSLSKPSAFLFIIEHLKLALLYYGRYPGLVLTTDTRPVRNAAESTQCRSVKKITDKRESKSEKPRASPAVKEAEDKGRYDGENGILSESDDDDEDVEEEEEEEREGDKNEDDLDLVDGIFAMDTINDSDLEGSEVDNDGDVTVTDQSLVSETSFSENVVGPIPSQSNIGLIICKTTPERIDKGTLALCEQPDFDWRSIEYEFDESVLRRGPGLASKCNSCGEEGHIADNCRVEKKTPLKSLPPITDWFKDMLNRVCYCCKDDYGMSKEQVTERKLYMRALEAYIRSHCPDARLHLFGSSCNGFGFRNSDMDICMTLDGKQKSDVDCISMITFLAKILRNNPECADVIAITGAKVPIVKFVLRRERLEADISLYNEVALWNTKLLSTYVHIDLRVHILGCTLKVFVKLCDIGDASRGSLSSYAYILMLLHFLQQREPPVIPVLQELYDTAEQPQRMVEGFNCWFYDNFQKLGSKWKAQNTESCGELWLGFLRYYTETFDYHRNVVCVRFRKALTKFEKMWNGKLICIEDPFVLSHNLGAGLSAGMAKFIRSTFERARERFGTPRRDISENSQQRQLFFFDTMFLNNGFQPPTGRNCSICGKIGHWAKECPYNRKNREQVEKKQQKKPQKTKEDKVEQNKEEENNKKVERSRSMSKSDKPTASSNSNSSKTSSSNTPENRNNVTAQTRQNTNPSSPLLPQSNRPQIPVSVLKTNSPLLNHMPLTPPLTVRPWIYPSPHRQPTAPLPHGQPTAPLSQRSPMALFSQRPPTATVPLSHRTPTAALPHGQPTALFSQRPPTTPLLHSPPTAPLRYRLPTAPHQSLPPEPFPGSPPTAPLPLGSPTSPLLRPYQFIHMINPNTTRPLAPCFSQAPPSQAQIRPQIRIPGKPPDVLTNFHPNAVIPHHENTLMNSPPLPQQFASHAYPQQHLVTKSPQAAKPRGRYAALVPGLNPMTANDFVNQTPHHGVISCQDLENQDNRMLAVEGDQVDGAKEKLGDHSVAQNATVRLANDGFSPSVIQSLQSMNISGIAIVDERVHGAGELQVNRHATKPLETSVVGGDKVQGTFKEKGGGKETFERFSTPPNVRNVADKSLTFNELASLVEENSPSGNVMTKANNNTQNVENRTEVTGTRNENHDVELRKNQEDVKHATVQQNEETAFHTSNTKIEHTKEPSAENSRNSRRRSNRRRNKQFKESKMNETCVEQTVKPKNTKSAQYVRQYSGKQEVDKEHPARYQGRAVRFEARTSKTPNQKSEKSSSISDKGGQGKDGKVKELKKDVGQEANTLDKAQKQQNPKTALKSAGTIVVKVNYGDDKRTVVVDGGKSSNDIVNHDPSKRRRRRPSRGEKSTTHTEDIVRRDQSRKTGEKNAKTEVKK